MIVFEPQDIDLIDTRLCKIKYLTLQNKWIHFQYTQFNSLIQKYKHLIQLSTKNQQQNINEQSINKNKKRLIYQQKLKELNTMIKKYCQLQPMDVIKANEIVHDDLQFNQIQFVNLITSLQQKIVQTRKITLQTQKKLQDLQAKKVLPNYYILQNSSKIDLTNTVKSIQAYDVYPRVIQKYKNKIIELKILKDTLQSQIRNFDIQSKKQIQSICSTVQSQISKKQFQPISSQIQVDLLPSKKNQEMTDFQKVVLIYKKKKFTNQKLRQRIQFLSKQLKIKTINVQKIKLANDSRIWNDISLMKNNQGQLFSDSNIIEMSVMNKACENMEFDVDISNILKPQKLKTLAAILQQKKMKRDQSQRNDKQFSSCENQRKQISV